MVEKPEIIDGLRNAMDRGYSMELAISSFVNAGYNKQDVLDSAKSLGGSFLVPEAPSQPQPKPIQNLQPPQSALQPIQKLTPQQPPQQTPPPQIPKIQKQIQSAPASPLPAVQPLTPTSNPINPQLIQEPPQQTPPQKLSQSPAPKTFVKEKKKGWGVVIFLLVILFLLLGVLVTIIFARDQVSSFLNTIGLKI